MANRLMTMEAANLFAGQDPPNASASNHLTLAEVKLPALDEQYTDHRAGGAPVAIEIDTFVQRLECTFMLLGWTPQVEGLFKSWQLAQNVFYIYGTVMDRESATAYQAKAVLKGRLAHAEPQNFRRGDAFHWTYSIRGIWHYELDLPGPSGSSAEIYYWDFYANVFRVGGQDVNANINKTLFTNVNASSAAG